MKKRINALIVLIILLQLVSCSKSEAIETSLSTTEMQMTTVEESSVETTNRYDYINEIINLDNIETTENEPPFQMTQRIVWDFIDDYSWTEDRYYLPGFGFDNLEYRQNLILFNEEMTGEYNNQLTIDDFVFFNCFDLDEHFEEKASWLYDNLQDSSGFMNIARAVCVENDLRFLIDEIPACYFYERFPEFMRIIERGDGGDFRDSLSIYRICDESLCDTHENYMDCYISIFNLSFDDYINLEDNYLRDAIQFFACYQYNTYRDYYLVHGYGDDSNHSNDIQQVRDLRNNRNVLLPTDEQYQEIMRELSELSAYDNLDIYRVETPEEYYLSYGFYPSDLLGVERYELNYEPYENLYEFDVIYIDQ